MVETLHEILEELSEQKKLMPFVKKGIIPVIFMDYMHIYAVYQGHRKSEKKMTSYEFAAQDCGVSFNTVRSVVKRMEE